MYINSKIDSGNFVCFGEIMMRISPKDFNTFRQSLPGDANITFAGSEANVAASLSLFGKNATYISSVPDNSLGEACIANLRSLGIKTDFVHLAKHGRIGLYFAEKGANQLPSKVIYDRSNSAFANSKDTDYQWEKIFDNAVWFHISGISPAISEHSAQASLQAVKEAKANGVTISCDLNYRKKLWNWDKQSDSHKLAQRVMSQLLEYVDVLIGNEEDAKDVLGIDAGETNHNIGQLDIERYPAIARTISEKFKNIKLISFTLRESISASHNRWGAMLYSAKDDRHWFSPLAGKEYHPYEIKHIVDRIGAGDSFAAGLIYALNDEVLSGDYQSVLDFASAASCLCHSISGDFNYISVEDVQNLMGGDVSGRVKR